MYPQFLGQVFHKAFLLLGKNKVIPVPQYSYLPGFFGIPKHMAIGVLWIKFPHAVPSCFQFGYL